MTSMTLSEHVKQLVWNSGRPTSHVARDADVDQGHFSRWLSGQRHLGQEAMDRVYELVRQDNKDRRQS